jgi:hypothetical protein
MSEGPQQKEWITLTEAIAAWRGAPSYDHLFRLVKRSKIETRKRGKYLTFRLADLQAYLSCQHDVQVVAQMIRGDWYTRQQQRSIQ